MTCDMYMEVPCVYVIVYVTRVFVTRPPLDACIIFNFQHMCMCFLFSHLNFNGRETKIYKIKLTSKINRWMVLFVFCANHIQERVNDGKTLSSLE